MELETAFPKLWFKDQITCKAEDLRALAKEYGLPVFKSGIYIAVLYQGVWLVAQEGKP